jgi:hypothetical protein
MMSAYREPPPPTIRCPICDGINLTQVTELAPPGVGALLFKADPRAASSVPTYVGPLKVPVPSHFPIGGRACLGCGHVMLGLSPKLLEDLRSSVTLLEPK